MPVHKVLNPFINDDIRCEDTFNRLGNTINIPVKKKQTNKQTLCFIYKWADNRTV